SRGAAGVDSEPDPKQTLSVGGRGSPPVAGGQRAGLRVRFGHRGLGPGAGTSRRGGTAERAGSGFRSGTVAGGPGIARRDAIGSLRLCPGPVPGRPVRRRGADGEGVLEREDGSGPAQVLWGGKLRGSRPPGFSV